MRLQPLRAWILAAFALGVSSQAAQAQWSYPGGYGGYGWGGWGSDPAAGRMAGLGAYARGAGVYAVDQAQADAIERTSLIEWNKALQARKKALRIEQEQQAAKDQVVNEAQRKEENIENGSTLNDLLEQILDFNAGKAVAYLSKVPLSAKLIRDIPFQPATEAVTLCISQLTGTDAVPPVFRDSRYLRQISALNKAATALLQEDVKGTISARSRKDLSDAITALRKRFTELNVGTDIEADIYLRTLASLSVLLQDKSLKQAIALLETYQKGSIGDLIIFMEAFNLTFGPATSPQQKQIYRNLVPLLTEVRDTLAKTDRPSALDKDGKALRASAKKVFKGMTWAQLEAQAKEEN